MPAHGFQTNFHHGLHDAQIYQPFASNHVLRKKLIQHAVRKIPGVSKHLETLHYKPIMQKSKDPHMQDLHHEGPKFNNNN